MPKMIFSIFYYVGLHLKEIGVLWCFIIFLLWFILNNSWHFSFKWFLLHDVMMTCYLILIIMCPFCLTVFVVFIIITGITTLSHKNDHKSKQNHKSWFCKKEYFYEFCIEDFFHIHVMVAMKQLKFNVESVSMLCLWCL